MDLRSFFAAHPRAALAFSGGTDSAYLLYAGLACGADLRPYIAVSPFQPAFEREDALRLCRQLGAEPRLLEADPLACPEIRANGPERCYFCKSAILRLIREAAWEDGYSLLLDGTNASDQAGDRPGMRALEEQGVLSPLRLCGLEKPRIRELSRQAGLFTWNKPAYACLATRIKTGEALTLPRLQTVEAAESLLLSLGFSDFRVRTRGDRALLQFPEAQLPAAREREAELRERLSPLFSEISIDPAGRKTSL